jgi:hypothetical protein
VDSAAGHGAGNRVPNTRLDPRRLVGDDQNLLAVVALEVLGLIGRESQSEIVVIAEFQLGRVQFGIGDFGAVDEPVDLRPQLRAHLPWARL